MIIGEEQDRELRHLAVFFELIHVGDILIGTPLIRNGGGEADVGGMEQGAQCGVVGARLDCIALAAVLFVVVPECLPARAHGLTSGRVGDHGLVDKLTVDPDGLLLCQCRRP